MSNHDKHDQSCTHVCLISDQPIPNLIPLLIEQPKKAIFLVSPEMTDQAERLTRVLRPRGVSVDFRKISSAYDFKAVEQACKDIMQSEGTPDRLVLNVTGGTKIAALAAFQYLYFNNHNQRIIYLDTHNNQLLQLAPENTATPIDGNLIKVRDYLIAYGMNPDPMDESRGAESRSGLSELAQLLIQGESLLSKLNAAIDRQSIGKKPSYLNLTLNELGEKAEDLAACFEKCGVATRTQSGDFNIPSKEKIFFCQGGWLEEYVFRAVKSQVLKGLDLALNVKVQWDGKGRRPTENEFDVLFTHSNRLHLISCKASNPERITTTGTRAIEALNELETLSDRVGGLFGRAMLVSARRLSDFDRERGKKMKIEIVDGQDVLHLKERIARWLR
ncbi:MAG: DUF1887 family CARF protein [Desulfocapsaceae bacterium]|nr:DUF1887 family CARF protein [Desulfocapsaceae bacterium]